MVRVDSPYMTSLTVMVISWYKVVRGRTLTCFAAVRDDVENAGAKYKFATVTSLL